MLERQKKQKVLADKKFFDNDAFKGDQSVPEGFTNSDVEVRLDEGSTANVVGKIDVDMGDPEDSQDNEERLFQPKGSGVDELYVEADSDIPESPNVSNEEYEGGEGSPWKVIWKDNPVVQRKINEMLDENLIYQESMNLLLQAKNWDFMYQGYDDKMIPPGLTRDEIKSSINFDDNDGEYLNK